MEARIVRAMGIIWIWLGDKCIMSNCYNCEESGYQRMTEEEVSFCKYPKHIIKIGFKTEYYFEYIRGFDNAEKK